jgi:tryptophan 6-halogenase
MRVGQVRRSWVKNCLAIGLSQGFIEPLEATALHIVHATLAGFLDAYLADGFGPAHRESFNTAIHDRYEGIRDYIVCHYRMNRRQDTQYWRDNADNQHLSDALKAAITCWFQGGDLEAVVRDLGIERYYAALSWHCLFAGYGQFPDQLRPPEPDLPTADLAWVDRFVSGCAMNFPSHDALLARLESAR